MIRFFWPAFLPLIAFGLFVLWRNKRLAAGHTVPPIEGVRFWSIIASIALAVGMMLFIGFSQERNAGNIVYEPAQLNQDGSFERGDIK